MALTDNDFRQRKRALIEQYAKPRDDIGALQVATTILPLAGLWWGVSQVAAESTLAVVLMIAAMSLFLLRSFALMHDAGHGSLFKSRHLNRFFGFLFGVLSGMPQYVWSRHHQHHHATNGNWSKYRGPLSTLTVDEYAALGEKQRRSYVRARRVYMAPLAGLLYLIVNPRWTWLKGTVDLIRFVIREKIAHPSVGIRSVLAAFKTRYWSTAAEYRHMTLNNLTLFYFWAEMCAWLGPWIFIPIYLASASLAGAAGIVLFTVQHNFEHSHATDDTGWSYDRAAILGTSHLVLPRWLRWFTADIGYHHVHHLSARIPNYQLAECHRKNSDLFKDVRKIYLSDVVPSLRYLLWDTREQKIISVEQFESSRQPLLGVAT